jgi:hypothetical protein
VIAVVVAPRVKAVKPKVSNGIPTDNHYPSPK